MNYMNLKVLKRLRVRRFTPTAQVLHGNL